MAKYIMPEQKHIEFDETNYESKSIDFKDLISKIRRRVRGLLFKCYHGCLWATKSNSIIKGKS